MKKNGYVSSLFSHGYFHVFHLLYTWKVTVRVSELFKNDLMISLDPYWKLFWFTETGNLIQSALLWWLL